MKTQSVVNLASTGNVKVQILSFPVNYVILKTAFLLSFIILCHISFGQDTKNVQNKQEASLENRKENFKGAKSTLYNLIDNINGEKIVKDWESRKKSLIENLNNAEGLDAQKKSITEIYELLKPTSFSENWTGRERWEVKLSRTGSEEHLFSVILKELIENINESALKNKKDLLNRTNLSE